MFWYAERKFFFCICVVSTKTIIYLSVIVDYCWQFACKYRLSWLSYARTIFAQGISLKLTNVFNYLSIFEYLISNELYYLINLRIIISGTKLPKHSSRFPGTRRSAPRELVRRSKTWQRLVPTVTLLQLMLVSDMNSGALKRVVAECHRMWSHIVIAKCNRRM